MEKICKKCQAEFQVTDDDLAFYKKVSPSFGGATFEIPAPDICPQCRTQRRMAWRNERSLYNRKCDATGEQVVSMYDENSKYKIFSQKEWWSDNWDGKEYGRGFDPSRSFFEQFNELQQEVPKIALLNIDPENSDYINRALKNKDCYMSFDVCWSENVLHSRTIYNSKDIIDSIFCWENCENLYECVNCSNSNNSTNCIDCSDISSCHYSYSLKGCRDCLFSNNLRNKQYCFENKELTKEEYDHKLKEINLSSHQSRIALNQKFNEMLKSCIHIYAYNTNCEESTGDFLENCKNVKHSFGAKDSQDSKFVLDSGWAKDVYDFDFSGGPEGSELSYEILGAAFPYHSAFLNASWNCKDSYYLSNCHYCKNCFGCVGLKREEHCIFNKKYSPEEYEKTVSEIVKKMQESGEWGEFFPIEISDFAYNETVAVDYFSLSKEGVVTNGWAWKDKVDNLMPSADYQIPDLITDIEQDIIQKVLICKVTKRPFKIQPKELAFYIKNSIPIPRKHPDQRYKERFSLRNPLRLHRRKCMNEGCANEFETTYAPDRQEIVYCESCYQKAVL